MNTEKLVLQNLVFNESFSRKVLNYLIEDYFSDRNEQLIFNLVKSYYDKYNVCPSKETLLIDLENLNGVKENDYQSIVKYIASLTEPENQDQTWLIDKTEKFCQERAIHIALLESINIVEGAKDGKDKGSIPKLLTEALAVSFDSKIGHDYLDDWESRFNYYTSEENHLPFDIDILNKITNGGLLSKSLTLFMAPPHGGKSRIMSHMAAAHLQDNRNVLYITLELSEMEVSKRIDANLLDIPIDKLKSMSREQFKREKERVDQKTKGKLVVREFPNGVHAGHFRHLLNELRLKKNFVPDVVYIDYLNICGSSRVKRGTGTNEFFKSISEELRALAIEYDLRIVSATQTNRGGSKNADPDLDDIAESFGVTGTADIILAIINTDELKALNQFMLKQLKNRMGNCDSYKRFVVGVDGSKFRLYNVQNDDEVEKVQQSQNDNSLRDSVNAMNGSKIDKNKFSAFN